MLLVAALLLGVAADRLDPLDRMISAGLSLRDGASSPALIGFMQGVSWLGGGVVRWAIVLMVCALLWRGVAGRAALRLLLTAAAANLASSLLKNVFDRPRPDLVPHLDHVTSWSYPSGHATSVSAIVIALALLAPPRWRGVAAIFAIAAVLLTALSRVMLGVHWASDVVGGTLLGAAFALAIAGVERRKRAPLSARSAIRER